MRLLFMALFPSVLGAQCPLNTADHFSCQSAGGNTQITLSADAEFLWETFDVPASGSLRISGPFTSRHLSTRRSTIAGDLTADGPLTIISSSGIFVTGRVTAPSLIFSALPEVGPNQFRGNGRGESVILGRTATVTASENNALILGGNLQVTGNLRASQGQVTLIATGSDTLTGPEFQIPSSPNSNPRTRVDTRGLIQAPSIEIYSEGFLSNQGRITGNEISLTAGTQILHSLSPNSVIEGNLVTSPRTILQGRVIRPSDGNNPGGISTTLGFPDLESGSFSGKSKTKLLPSQYSASSVARSRLPSAVSLKNLKKKKPTQKTLVATRGVKSKKKAKKRSFFGIVTKK